MFISDFAIKRPIVTITVMLAVVVFGIISLASLQTDEFPDIQAPIVAVTIPYPGASPEVVEREIIDPVEDAIFSINGIDASKTTSSAIDGLAQFLIVFNFNKNVQQAEQDVRDAISSKRGDLPQDMEEPVITRFDPADLPIVTLTLSSHSISIPRLTRIADEVVARDLRGLPGVADVRLVGGLKRELTVSLKPQALQAARVSLPEVVQALQAQNLAAPVGNLTEGFEERSIRLLGRPKTPDDFARLVVTERGGHAIRLGQIADVHDGHEEQRTLALRDGREAVGLEVLKAKGYSTTQVSSEIRRRAEALRGSLPPGARLELVQDSGARVSRSVEDVEMTLVEGALLTVLVVFVFLNSWRSTVITGLALPVSVLAAFIGVLLSGFTLNTMSLLGLSLAIGILIDDAIVVRENIVRHIEMGKDHYRASQEGTNEIGLAVLATTSSIVAVFVPVAFISGLAGQWLKPFALTIAASVLVSLFVSFSLDPMLSAYWPDPQVEKGQHGGRIGRALAAFNRWFERLARGYEGVIAWALDHRSFVIGLAALALVVSLAGQALFGGAGFVPVTDRSEIDLIVETPPGSSLAYTRRKVEEILRVTRAHPEVAYTYAAVGTPIPLRAPGVDQALVYVRLVPRDKRSISQEALGAEIRRELTRIAGVNVSVFTSGFGGTVKSIDLQLRGPDAARLLELARKIRSIVSSVPGAVDIGLSTRGAKPELEVSVDRGLAGAMGVSVAEVAQALRTAFAGLHVGDWVDPTGETRQVRVRFAPEYRQSLSDLRQLPITAGVDESGAPVLVPLAQLATVTEAVAPAQVNHLARQRVIDVQANVHGRALSEVMGDIEQGLTYVPLPHGYTLTQGGDAESQHEVFSRIFIALGVAVMLMYFILVIQFGSFLDPIAIIASLPLSLIGVVAALLVTGDTLNIMSLIGVILLMGIVAKNAILLIDFAKWSRERGASLRQGLIEAGRIRLRPIIMTSVAIVAGMIPVALGLGEGGDFRAPLGRAVIGGVVTSTLLTLLVIPTAYEVLDGWRSRVMRLLSAWRPAGLDLERASAWVVERDLVGVSHDRGESVPLPRTDGSSRRSVGEAADHVPPHA
jgi:HAE1 family hydrophobic/amphiphilic exporter-1